MILLRDSPGEMADITLPTCCKDRDASFDIPPDTIVIVAGSKPIEPETNKVSLTYKTNQTWHYCTVYHQSKINNRYRNQWQQEFNVKKIIAAIKFRLVQSLNASTTQVVETSVTVYKSPIQDYDCPDRWSCSTYSSLLGSNLSQSQLSYRSIKGVELYTYNTPSFYLSCLAVRANICWSPMRNALNMHSVSWWSLSVARAINKTINLHGNVVR